MEAPGDERVSFKLPQNMMNNPDSIDLKGLGRKAVADKAAADEKARKDALAAEMKTKYISAYGAAEEEVDPTEKLDKLFSAMVPRSGNCDTVAGELVRAMMRLLYRDANDGDLFYDGYGIETCGAAVGYIIDTVPEINFTEMFENIALRQLEDDAYTNALNDICDQLVTYILSHDELLVPNETDFHDYQTYYENSFQDEWQPEYEANLDIPDEVCEHMRRQNISIWDVKSEVEDWLSYESYFKGAEIERPWSHYNESSLTITGLTHDGYEQILEWNRSDRVWEGYIDELNSEYGDPYEDDDEEYEDDDMEEGLVGDLNIDLDASGSSVAFMSGSAGVKNESYVAGGKVRYKGKETTIKSVEYDDEYGYDLLIKNPTWDGKDRRYEYIWVGDMVDPVNENVVNESNKYRDFEWTDELYAVVKNNGDYAGVPCKSYEEAQQLSYHPGSKIFKLVLEDDPSEETLED